MPSTSKYTVGRMKQERKWFYGNVVAVACGLALCGTLPSHTAGISIFINYFLTDLEITRTTITSIWTVSLIGSSLLTPLFGVALDRYGASKLIVLLGIAFVILLLCMSAVQTYIQLLGCLMLLRFVGAESICILAFATVNVWFVKKRGRATAILTVMNSASEACPPLILLTIERLGWRGAYRVLAAAAVMIYTVVAALMVDKPETIGVLPDGCAVKSSDKGEGEDGTRETSLSSDAEWPFFAVIKNPLYWTLIFAGLTVNMFWSGFNLHGIDVFEQQHLDSHTASLVYVTLSMSGAGSSLYASYLLNKTRNKLKLFSVCSFLGVVAFATFPLVSSQLSTLVWGMIYGIWAGSTFVLQVVIVPDTFGTANIGKLTSIATAINTAGAALGPMYWNTTKNYYGTYYPCMYCTSAAMFVVGVILYNSRKPRVPGAQPTVV